MYVHFCTPMENGIKIKIRNEPCKKIICSENLKTGKGALRNVPKCTTVIAWLTYFKQKKQGRIVHRTGLKTVKEKYNKFYTFYLKGFIFISICHSYILVDIKGYCRK